MVFTLIVAPQSTNRFRIPLYTGFFLIKLNPFVHKGICNAKFLLGMTCMLTEHVHIIHKFYYG